MYHLRTNVASTWNKARRNKIRLEGTKLILQLWQNTWHEGTDQIYMQNKTVDYGNTNIGTEEQKCGSKGSKGKGIKNTTSRGAKISAD
jgi:hypothetical protein